MVPACVRAEQMVAISAIITSVLGSSLSGEAQTLKGSR